MPRRVKETKNQFRTPAGRDGVREYFDRAMVENQPRLTDLIPKSLWAYLAMLLLGVINIYACQQAFLHTRALDPDKFPVRLFDTTGPGNIAAWCMSVMLLLLSVGSVFVYLLRRHKADDYKGRYRLWLQMALFSGVLSFEAATGAHEILAVALGQFDISSPWNESSFWWLILVSLGAVYLSLRLLIEFKARPGMLVMLAMVVMGMIAAGCSHLGEVIGESALTTEVAQSSLLMGATLVACLMAWLNARRIYLDAQQGRAIVQQPVATGRVTTPKKAVTITEHQEHQLPAVGAPAAEWDDWDELEEASEENTEYREDDLDDLDEQDEHQEHQEQDIDGEAQQEYEECEDPWLEEDEAVEESEEVIYSAYSSETEERQASNKMTVYETPVDDSQRSQLFIPPQTQKTEYEPFDEDAFWEQYDLTKMSRKQLKTMRKKLNRLKRKHAERQRAA